jgi:hypothetical protein
MVYYSRCLIISVLHLKYSYNPCKHIRTLMTLMDKKRYDFFVLYKFCLRLISNLLLFRKMSHYYSWIKCYKVNDDDIFYLIKFIMAEKKTKLVEIKTKPTSASIDDFINGIKDEQKRKDCFVLLELMKKATGEEPVLWSNSIIGFGNKRYTSPATGRQVDWLCIGFSPRKANLSLYLSININLHAETLEKLGKHKAGVGCLYINKLEDIDLSILKELINTAAAVK